MNQLARFILILPTVLIISCQPMRPGSETNGKKTLGPDVIYGQDDRVEFFQIVDPQWRRMAASTVAVIDKRKLKFDEDSESYKVSSQPYGPIFSLCADEPFYSQPSSSFCSGFLIGPDIIVTAGHCIRTQLGCENASFVFNYFYENQDTDLTTIASRDVYDCKELIHSQANSVDRTDYAVLRLDRPVKGYTPLLVRTQDQVRTQEKLTVIGYPSGLPGKFAAGGLVRSNSEPGYFVTTLDTYGGNSGSAVFNSETGLVEGILVRGDTDFAYDQENQCRRSNVCKETECRGEEVTRIQYVLNHLTPKDLAPLTTSQRAPATKN